MSLPKNEMNSSYLSYTSVNSNLKKDIIPLKICLLGDVAVGKTSLFYMFGDGVFTDKHNPTMNCQFKIKEITIGPKTSAELKVWDTCGEEKFRSITQQYYKEADGIVLIFDLTNKNTFNNLDNWLENINNYCKKQTQVFLVGNKMDLNDEREIDEDNIKKFYEKHKLRYIPISAKDGTNVTLVFEELAANCVQIITAEPECEIDSAKLNNDFSLGTNKITSFAGQKRKSNMQSHKDKEVGCC